MDIRSQIDVYIFHKLFCVSSSFSLTHIDRVSGTSVWNKNVQFGNKEIGVFKKNHTDFWIFFKFHAVTHLRVRFVGKILLDLFVSAIVFPIIILRGSEDKSTYGRFHFAGNALVLKSASIYFFVAPLTSHYKWS